MLDLINYEFRYDFKYRLLLCFINNYYSKHYENNKNCKILFISQEKSKLIQNYSIIYKMVKEFSIDDIYTLKKFYQGKYNEKVNIFTKLKNNNISFNTLLEGIKKEYKENKSIYFNRLTDSMSVKDNINVIFTTNFSMCNISNMYLVKDIFILDILTKYKLDNNYDTNFISGIKMCLKDYKKVKDIGNNIYNKGKNIILNLYFNDDMEIVDFIENELITCLRNEDDN